MFPTSRCWTTSTERRYFKVLDYLSGCNRSFLSSDRLAFRTSATGSSFLKVLDYLIEWFEFCLCWNNEVFCLVSSTDCLQKRKGEPANRPALPGVEVDLGRFPSAKAPYHPRPAGPRGLVDDPVTNLID
jgi:hypothetical protein